MSRGARPRFERERACKTVQRVQCARTAQAESVSAGALRANRGPMGRSGPRATSDRQNSGSDEVIRPAFVETRPLGSRLDVLESRRNWPAFCASSQKTALWSARVVDQGSPARPQWDRTNLLLGHGATDAAAVRDTDNGTGDQDQE